MNDDIMKKVAEVAPRHYAFLLKSAGEIKSSPFRDETLGEMNVLIKKAIDWNALKGGIGVGARAAGKGALALGGAVGVAAAGGIALALAGDMYDAAKRGITKGRDYKAMMQANPQLQKMTAKEVQKAFSVLHRFNPEFAGDPTVAGAWVGRQVHMTTMGNEEYANLNALKPLIDSRKSISDVKKLSPFKPEGARKGPSPLTKGEYHEGLNSLHDRMTNFEASMAPMPFYSSPGGGNRTTP